MPSISIDTSVEKFLNNRLYGTESITLNFGGKNHHENTIVAICYGNFIDNKPHTIRRGGSNLVIENLSNTELFSAMFYDITGEQNGVIIGPLTISDLQTRVTNGYNIPNDVNNIEYNHVIDPVSDVFVNSSNLLADQILNCYINNWKPSETTFYALYKGEPFLGELYRVNKIDQYKVKNLVKDYVKYSLVFIDKSGNYDGIIYGPATIDQIKEKMDTTHIHGSISRDENKFADDLKVNKTIFALTKDDDGKYKSIGTTESDRYGEFDISVHPFNTQVLLVAAEDKSQIFEISHSYSIGDIVVPTTYNGYQYRCIKDGVSDSSEPTWPENELDIIGSGTAKFKTFMLYQSHISGPLYPEVNPSITPEVETYNKLILSFRPNLFYTLNELSGPGVIDASLFKNNGLYNGTVTYNHPAILSSKTPYPELGLKSVYFNGSDGSCITSSSLVFSDFPITLVTFVNVDLTTLGEDMVIASTNVTSSVFSGVEFRIFSDGSVGVLYGDGAGVAESNLKRFQTDPGLILDNTDYCIAIIARSFTEVSIYINGVEETTINESGTGSSISWTGSLVIAGRMDPTNSGKFLGYMDNIMLIDECLLSEDITLINNIGFYNQREIIPERTYDPYDDYIFTLNPVAYYKMDDKKDALFPEDFRYANPDHGVYVNHPTLDISITGTNHLTVATLVLPGSGFKFNSTHFQLWNGSNDMPFTINIWSMFKQLTHDNILFSKEISDGLGNQIFIKVTPDGELVVIMYSDDQNFTTWVSNINIEAGIQTGIDLYSFTYDGSQSISGLKVYVNNGEVLPEQTLVSGAGYTGQTHDDGKIYVGCSILETSTPSYSSAYYSHLTLFDFALNITQIQQIYQLGYGTIIQTGNDYDDYVLRFQPQIYYKLDETSGTDVIDLGSKGNDGTYAGSPTLNQPNLYEESDAVSGSVLFDGVDDIVTATIADGAPTGQFTIGFQFKHISSSATYDQALFALGDNATGSRFTVRIDNGSVARYYLYAEISGAHKLWETGDMRVGVNQIVLTTDGNNLQDTKLYMNGKEITEVRNSLDLTDPMNVASGNVSIGGLTWDSNYHINSQIQRVFVIYDQKLSAQDVQTLYELSYNNEIPYDLEMLRYNPSLFYKFDEGSGTTLVDYSYSKSDGTYAGSPSWTTPGHYYQSSGYVSFNNSAYATIPLTKTITSGITIHTVVSFYDQSPSHDQIIFSLSNSSTNDLIELAYIKSTDEYSLKIKGVADVDNEIIHKKQILGEVFNIGISINMSNGKIILSFNDTTYYYSANLGASINIDRCYIGSYQIGDVIQTDKPLLADVDSFVIIDKNITTSQLESFNNIAKYAQELPNQYRKFSYYLDPYLYYEFNENNEQWDSSLNGRSCFINSGVTKNRDPLITYGQSIEFLGTIVSSILTPIELDTFTSISIAFWMKSTQTTAGHMVSIGDDQGAFSGLSIMINDGMIDGTVGNLRIEFPGTSSAYIVFDKMIADEQTHFIVINLPSTTISDLVCYVDGELVSNETDSGNLSNTFSISTLYDLTLGKSTTSTDSDTYYIGLMDEFQLYDKVLTENQIKSLYKIGDTGVDIPTFMNYAKSLEPKALYRLDEEVGATIAFDYSGDEKDGTYVNSPTLQESNNHTGVPSIYVDAGDYVRIPNTIPTGSGAPFSIFMVYKHKVGNDDNWKGLFDRDTTSSPRVMIMLGYNTHGLSHPNYISSYSYISSWSIKTISRKMITDDDQWHSICLTRTGGTAEIYFDGVLQDTHGAFQSGVVASNSKDNRLGMSDNSTVNGFEGNISYSMVIDRVLDATEVSRLHNLAFYNNLDLSVDKYSRFLSPQAFYKFNETAGTSATDSSNTNDGTYSGTFTLNDTLSPIGEPAVYLGSDGRIDIPEMLSSSAFSIFLTFKADLATPSDYSVIFDKNSGAATNRTFIALDYDGVFNDKIISVTSNNGTEETSIYNYPDIEFRDDVWHSLTVTWDGTESQLYFDNVNVGSIGNLSSGLLHEGGITHVIGHHMNPGSSNNFVGHLANFMIFDKEISRFEIKTLHELFVPVKLTRSLSTPIIYEHFGAFSWFDMSIVSGNATANPTGGFNTTTTWNFGSITTSDGLAHGSTNAGYFSNERASIVDKFVGNDKFRSYAFNVFVKVDSTNPDSYRSVFGMDNDDVNGNNAKIYNRIQHDTSVTGSGSVSLQMYTNIPSGNTPVIPSTTKYGSTVFFNNVPAQAYQSFDMIEQYGIAASYGDIQVETGVANTMDPYMRDITVGIGSTRSSITTVADPIYGHLDYPAIWWNTTLDRAQIRMLDDIHNTGDLVYTLKDVIDVTGVKLGLYEYDNDKSATIYYRITPLVDLNISDDIYVYFETVKDVSDTWYDIYGNKTTGVLVYRDFTDTDYDPIRFAGELSSYDDFTLTLSPISYYRFNETNGLTAYDLSGNRYDGEYRETPYLSQNVNSDLVDIQKGFQSDGVVMSNDSTYKVGHFYNDTSSLSLWNGSNDLPFSVNIWCKPLDLTNDIILFAKTGTTLGNDHQIIFKMTTTGNLEVVLYRTSADYTTYTSDMSYSGDIDSLTMYSITSDGTTQPPGLLIYRNGESVSYSGVDTGTGYGLGQTTDAGNIYVGTVWTDDDVNRVYSEAVYSDLSLYDKELTAQNVLDLYNNSLISDEVSVTVNLAGNAYIPPAGNNISINFTSGEDGPYSPPR